MDHTNGPGVFVANVSPPVAGWTAYYVELIFPHPDPAGLPQTYSTQVYVTPDTLPFNLIDPLGESRGVRFWKHQVQLALTGRSRAQVPADVLAGYFPIPVFDTNVTDLVDAAAVFKRRKRDPQARAIQHCLTVRLNVANGSCQGRCRLFYAALFVFLTSFFLDDLFGFR